MMRSEIIQDEIYLQSILMLYPCFVIVYEGMRNGLKCVMNPNFARPAVNQVPLR